MESAAVAYIPNRTKEDIAEDLLAARKMKAEAEKLVLEMEEELIKALGGAPEEGSKSHRLNGFKVELKGVINRKVEWEIFDAECKHLEEREPFFMPPVKTKRELDETYFKRLAKDHPAVYARLAKGVEAKPGKVGVTVSRTE